ncbi:hypothetical protein [Mucisphaera calidilacus]|uniref:AMMECR1 domain-containing protein n=1 Tax=Mucisphaera calidilacus TaxID=2527982 RepID=A0A518BYB4_9BACT|nr:hypothetical protein [Mucisphaera calidilacus]QDU71969.1 hypothetical protein Pan265_18280 [Mucisphaera calidilacus]
MELNLRQSPPQPARTGRAGVSPKRNTRTARLSTIVNTLLILCLSATPLHADDNPDQVSWLTGFEAHRLVARWIVDGQVTQPLPVIAVENVTAVKITLRDQGYAVGRAEANVLADDAIDGTDAINLAQALERAFNNASGHARARLEHLQQRPDDNAPRRGRAINVDMALRTLHLDLQIAHRLEPVSIRPYDPAGTLFQQWTPGYHLLVAQAAPTESARIWPGTTVAQGTSVDGQLGRMLKQLGRGIGRFDAAQLLGLSLHRARVTHIVPQHRDGGRSELERGHKVYPLGTLSERTVAALRSRLADHLKHRLRVRGNLPMDHYLPAGNRYLTAASPRDTALAALAITRWANASPGRELDQQHALRTALWLGEQALENNTSPRDPETEALILLTLLETDQPGVKLAVRDALILRLENDLDNLAQQHPGRTELTLLNALHHAGQRLAREDLNQAAARHAPDAIERVLENPGLSRLPWAAELLHALNQRPELIRYRNRLDTLVDELQHLQIVEAVNDGPDDLMGAIRLGNRNTSPGELPDWTTAYALRFAAEIARAADVPDTRLDRQVFASLAARYLAHLSMTESGAYYCPYPDGAIGGVRNSLLDQQITLRATAESLLAIVRYEQWLARVRQANPDNN